MRTAATRGLSRRGQAGAAIVEFALVAMIFFTILLGIMEFGRWLFTLNAASEATRLGARLAVVCSMNDSSIKQRMRAILAGITDDRQIGITYSPSVCDTADCLVTVALNPQDPPPPNKFQFTPLIPFLAGSFDIPSFTTVLTREALDSGSVKKTVCTS